MHCKTCGYDHEADVADLRQQITDLDMEVRALRQRIALYTGMNATFYFSLYAGTDHSMHIRVYPTITGSWYVTEYSDGKELEARWLCDDLQWRTEQELHLCHLTGEPCEFYTSSAEALTMLREWEKQIRSEEMKTL